MKPFPRLTILAILIFTVATPPTRAADIDGFEPMFNGKDLTGWVPCNIAVGTKNSDTFTVKDNIILCTGIPTGVLRTDKMYENFIAELEWRHMVPKGNSGFFLWADDITSKGVPFSRGLEVQILDGPNHPERVYTTHGDLFPIHGATAKPDHPGKKGGSRSYPTEDRSKPSPEWNHYRIEAIDGVVTLSVNGKVVNSTREVSPRKGYLCLESEGGVIHFRNLRIKELPPSANLDPKHVAIADRGFKTLYNGVNLDGWTFTDPAAKAVWTPTDWILRYDPSRLPAAPVPNSTISTSGNFDMFTMIVDVKTDSKIELLLPGMTAIALPAADPTKEAKARKGWRRFQIERHALEVLITGDDFAAVKYLAKAIDPKSSGGPIGLKPDGPADFGNLYLAPWKPGERAKE